MARERRTSKIEIRRGDLILIMSIFLIGIVTAFFGAQTSSYSREAKIRVTVAGEEQGIYALKDEREIIINKEFRNIIQVKSDNSGDMYVQMKESNCPNRDCVHHASINLPKQTIICLPNKLVVEIIGGGTKLDAYTY